MTQPTSPAALEHVIAALLRGEPLDRRQLRHFGAAAIHEAANLHEVLPLIADRLALAPELPVDFREHFLEELHRITAVDLALEAELRRLHRAFEAAQVPLLLVKGSHLAYTHYPRPDLRARVDSDVLVARGDRDRAEAILAGLGYAAPAKLSGELTATQKTYIRTADGADLHVIDLHWRLASPQVFARVLSFEELYASSVPIRTLGAAARGPCDVHALVIACMHRIAHHHDEADRFKWLLDIHLIASGLSPAQWEAFLALALEREVSAVCLDGLQRAAEWFHTVIPAAVLDDPRLPDARSREATAEFLHVRPRAREVLDDLRVVPTWSGRLQLLREHMFPEATYMREVYAPGSRLPLAILYALRIVRGAAAWMR